MKNHQVPIPGLVAVELFHLLFLDQIGRKLEKKHCVLKGGCNLRFFLKSIRYSEDIDLDVHTVSKDTLAKAVNKILNSPVFEIALKAKEIEIIRISSPKQTETTQRWKVELKALQIPFPLHTKIEFSRRKTDEIALFEPVDPTVIATYQLMPIYATHYSQEVALKQKIWALILRTETQARDVFDLFHLLNLGAVLGPVPQEMYIRLKEAEEKALAIPYEAFKSQVLSYLPLEYHTQYGSPEFWDMMLLQISKCLNKAVCG